MAHTLRIIASFGLLGAVVAGIVFGWSHNPSVDPRGYGLLLGLIVGLAVVAIGHRSDEATAKTA